LNSFFINFSIYKCRHRGDSANFAENSMEAFVSALSKDDVDGIECDISWSNDGYYFALHDSSLTRTMINELTEPHLLKDVIDVDVEDLSWDVIDKVPISRTGARVPRVEEILEVCSKNNKFVVWEMKLDNVKDSSRHEEYINGFADIIDYECSINQYVDWDYEKKMIFISFDFNSLKILRRRYPKNPIYYLIHYDSNSGFVNRNKTLDESLKESKFYGFDGVESSYEAFINVPHLKEIINAAGLKAGIYVGKWNDDPNLRPIGDRWESEHQLPHNNDYAIYTSNLPSHIIYKGCIWSD